MRITVAILTVIMLCSLGWAVEENQGITVGTGMLKIGGYLQTGYVMVSEKVSTPQYITDPTDPDFGAYTGDQTVTTDTNTFRVRRARVKLSSEIIEKIVGGVMEYDFVDSGIKEVYFWFSPQWEPFKLLIGREKLPWMQENITSAGELTWIDRSIVADKFGHEYDYGLRLDLNYPFNDMHRIMVGLMYSNGYGVTGTEQPTDFDSDIDMITVTNGIITATSKRTDLKDIAFRAAWNGKFNDDFNMGIGAAIMMNKATNFDVTSHILNTVESQPITVDVALKYTQLNVVGSYTMDTHKNTGDLYEVDPNDANAYIITTSEWKDEVNGMMGGASYAFPIEGTPILTAIEPALRYATYTDKQTLSVTAPAGSLSHNTQDDEISQIAVGLNFLMEKHNAKFQLNYVIQNEKLTPYAPDDPTDPDSPWVTKEPTKTDDSKIQLQFQVKF
jgi:hypothetical protein